LRCITGAQLIESEPAAAMIAALGRITACSDKWSLPIDSLRLLDEALSPSDSSMADQCQESGILARNYEASEKADFSDVNTLVLAPALVS
jgi:hypothetical protein